MSREDVEVWVFDIDDRHSRLFSRKIQGAVLGSGLFAVLIAAWAVSLWFVLMTIMLAGLTGWWFHEHSKKQPSKSLRLTHLGACHHRFGQMPLAFQNLWRYPWCTVVEFSEVASAARKQTWYLILWRHHYTRASWRHLMLVLLWLSEQDTGHE